jgi:hypothetical protein
MGWMVLKGGKWFLRNMYLEHVRSRWDNFSDSSSLRLVVILMFDSGIIGGVGTGFLRRRFQICTELLNIRRLL